MSGSRSSPARSAARPYGSPPAARQVAVRTGNGGELVLGSMRAGSSRNQILDWSPPILDACGAGDASSLKTMYTEARYSSDPRTRIPLPDEMIMAAIDQGRFLILQTIADLCPDHDWSDAVFEAGLKCDLEARGNHYLLAYCRWSKDPLRAHGQWADALMWAVLLGDLESAILLLSWGANPNGCKWKGMYSHLLIAASMYGTTRARSPPMVNLLLTYGAKPQGQGILSWVAGATSPLHGFREVVCAEDILGQLLHRGSHVDEFPPVFESDCPPAVLQVPLTAAVLAEQVQLVDFLLSHGPDLSILDSVECRTAHEHACDLSSKCPGLLSVFTNHGVSPATLWGILDSNLASVRKDHCNCRNRMILNKEVRYLPTLKPEI